MSLYKTIRNLSNSYRYVSEQYLVGSDTPDWHTNTLTTIENQIHTLLDLTDDVEKSECAAQVFQTFNPTLMDRAESYMGPWSMTPIGHKRAIDMGPEVYKRCVFSFLRAPNKQEDANVLFEKLRQCCEETQDGSWHDACAVYFSQSTMLNAMFTYFGDVLNKILLPPSPKTAAMMAKAVSSYTTTYPQNARKHLENALNGSSTPHSAILILAGVALPPSLEFGGDKVRQLYQRVQTAHGYMEFQAQNGPLEAMLARGTINI